MKLIWGDMLRAAVAWLCGVGAMRWFPEASTFVPQHVSDWFTLAMFKPFPLLVSAFLFVAGTVLACRLIARNALAWWRLLSWRRSDALLHLSVLALALFVLAVQWLKAPTATALLTGGIALVGVGRTLRNWAVRKEHAVWLSEKKQRL